MSIERRGRKYADSTLIGDGQLSQDPDDLAWSEGCPLGRDLIKPDSQGGRGPEVMRKRYGEVIFWFRYLTEALRVNKPEIAETLTTPRRRLPGEPLGIHSKNWLPPEMTTHVFRAHAGYVLPRLLVDYINANPEDKIGQIDKGIGMFEKAARKSKTEIDLVVHFAESLARVQCDPLPVLKRLLGTAKLEEDNLFTAYRETHKTMMRRAPHLRDCYRSLKPEQFDEYKIFHI